MLLPSANLRILKLQLRVRHSDVGTGGRNVRLWHAIMVHCDCGFFCVPHHGGRVSACLLWTPNNIILRGNIASLGLYNNNREPW